MHANRKHIGAYEMHYNVVIRMKIVECRQVNSVPPLSPRGLLKGRRSGELFPPMQKMLRNKDDR